MFKEYEIKEFKGFGECESSKQFVLQNHYLKSLSRGNKKVYSLYLRGKLMAVAAFGIPVGRNVQEYYSTGGTILELKRFCIHPGMPKNSASWYMSQILNRLKQDSSIESVVSYADTRRHQGTIYKASNYKFVGIQKYSTKSFKYKGKELHSRAVYQKTKVGAMWRALMKLGKVKTIMCPPKNIFVYNLWK